MKRVYKTRCRAALVAVLVVGAFASFAGAGLAVQTSSLGKVAICHKTSSGDFVKLKVGKNAMDAHRAHDGDVVLMDENASCPTSSMTPPAAATESSPDKVAICHRTKSVKHPFVKISVGKNAVGAHLKHERDMVLIDEKVSCPTTTMTNRAAAAPSAAESRGRR